MSGKRRGNRPSRRGISKAPRIDLSTETVCPRCEKPESLCVCAAVNPLKNQIAVVVLQHPQEPDKLLGTAKLLTLSLENSKLHIGLSVPNLKKILGHENFDPKRWGVLYLGSGVKNSGTKTSSTKAPGTKTLSTKTLGTKPPAPQLQEPGIYFTTRDGDLLPETEQETLRESMEGFILLDGTWSQAKALWWRNPWLLKLRRMILVPAERSSYRELRKEPRSECLSTLETAAETLTALGEAPTIEKELKMTFRTLLDRYREALKNLKSAHEQSPRYGARSRT